MNNRNIWIVSLALLVALVSACGGSDEKTGSTGTGIDPSEAQTGACTQFALKEIKVPGQNEATELKFGLDLDGDGNAENKLGGLLGFFSERGLDAQEALTEALNDGDLVLLSRLQADDMVNDPSAILHFFQGNSLEAPDFSGSGAFSVAASSPSDAFVTGSIENQRFVGGPGTVAMSLPLVSGQAPLNVEFVGARVEVDASEDGLFGGVLGGAISVEALNNSIIPVLADLINEFAEEDPGSVKLVLEIFDEAETGDNNGIVSAEEIINNSLTKLLIDADVDLFDAEGKFSPRQDGELDAISFGLGFEAVGADFDAECVEAQ